MKESVDETIKKEADRYFLKSFKLGSYRTPPMGVGMVKDGEVMTGPTCTRPARSLPDPTRLEAPVSF